ncbi:hypothetical protein [Amycolatopsis sp.]|uniref:hypothetical protein n=1 Tax=Amycolatopsis sp. TaxID=37632 RepID=UPI002BE69943|nr:hypothetical protein [Amycolatopsis sp.]HVV09872.1 hypothetical protein [Amycolatopsis sp.]
MRSDERAAGAWADDVVRLAEAAARPEPGTRPLADEVRAPAAEHLGATGTG